MCVFSYPALWVVPSIISDDSVRRFYRNYRHNRVPIITWRHQKTSALLLRGAGYHGKNLIGMLKSTHPSSTGIFIYIFHFIFINYFSIVIVCCKSFLGTLNSESNSSVEQERYLSAIVASTPLSSLRHSGAAWGLSDSTLSINSLLMAADEDILSPDISRRYLLLVITII